ncbi:STAS domain-containing protein [Wenzhouxiangella marina]|uniref:MlaB-like STAS domain-containing protein n=1 Tax=Wenzhouxiangella marina TaxID=1579979 RepID=A0A0K0XXH5_9GAMM|nr:STAS domain-containing protein [Wenzhouxiangella marina]AKS42311.1 hypothetical protein WM2015_1945 [Wenzhouxiangella marina]MBB6085916.1 ABC-type transporter Mla MlaB component [Wenzhouxiangella marina]
MGSPAETAFRLAGELTAEAVARCHANSLAAARRSELPGRIDLADVTRTDSSALALLLEWQTWARERQQDIEFSNPPDSLRVLAKLSQVSSLLGWDDTPDRTEQESPS